MGSVYVEMMTTMMAVLFRGQIVTSYVGIEAGCKG